MDIASLSTLPQNQTLAAVQLAVLKKVIDVEAQAALALVEALPQTASVSPPNLGNNVDTSA